jgi:hypothetical protein
VLHEGLRRFWLRVVNKVQLGVGSGLKEKLDDEEKGPSLFLEKKGNGPGAEENIVGSGPTAITSNAVAYWS